MRRLKALLRYALRITLGTPEIRDIAAQARIQSGDVPGRLQDLCDKLSPRVRPCDASPIFLLSAGWRSGSTLLQRMIMEKSGDILMWGEPFDHASIFDRMMDQLRCFTSSWPPESWFISRMTPERLSDRWIANLYPDTDDLLLAHRSFFDTLFGKPAALAGAGNWGIKDVRLSIEHAHYFRVVYPKCKIILLYRDPRAAYRSYRTVGPWFRRWPDRLVATPFAFGRQWVEMTRGFIAGHERVGALLVRYEDLDSQDCVDRLGQYLGWAIPRAATLRRIGYPNRGETRESLPRLEQWLLDLAVGRARSEAGYD